jgi:(p)ppGpp synthase/HD superfamily hydrolase
MALLPKTRDALEFARRQHAGQLRNSDGQPFIEHPIEVSRMLYRLGAPDHVVAAGLLHDVLEKTAVGATELRRRFGPRVARLVRAVSEDDRIRGYVARKAALRQQVAAAGPEALALFAADKISKIRELRRAVETAEASHRELDLSLVRPRRLLHFRRCLGLLEDRAGESPLLTELRSELAGLRRDLRAHTELSAAA